MLQRNVGDPRSIKPQSKFTALLSVVNVNRGFADLAFVITTFSSIERHREFPRFQA